MQLDSIKAKTFRFRKLVSLGAILTHKDHSPAVYAGDATRQWLTWLWN